MATTAGIKKRSFNADTTSSTLHGRFHLVITGLFDVRWRRKTVKPEDVPLTKGNYPTYPGMDAVKEPGRLKGTEFLRWVSLVLNNPTFTKQTDGHAEIEAFARFARLALRAGQIFDPDKLSAEMKAAIEAGIEDGHKNVLALIERDAGVAMNGWTFFSDLGYKDTDWLNRARFGYIAILAPIPCGSHTAAFCVKDSTSRPLSGENRYTITFELNNLPPVTEFWEIPLYDREGYFVDNPINRYSSERLLGPTRRRSATNSSEQ
jgi:uncharacterized protein DUF1214